MQARKRWSGKDCPSRLLRVLVDSRRKAQPRQNQTSSLVRLSEGQAPTAVGVIGGDVMAAAIGMIELEPGRACHVALAWYLSWGTRNLGRERRI